MCDILAAEIIEDLQSALEELQAISDDLAARNMVQHIPPRETE
jgi:hypothetical protein